MIIGVQGTKQFDDYDRFLWAMRIVLSDIKDEDDSLVIYSSGPHQINRFVAGFCNTTENSLRAKGIKIKFVLVPPQTIEDRAESLDMFLFLCEPGQRLSRLANTLDEYGVDVRDFRY